jgi:hypothetical protein
MTSLSFSVSPLAARRRAADGDLIATGHVITVIQLNGHVEQAHRMHTEEFSQVADLPWMPGELGPYLLAWEQVHNTARPHQALGYRTPLEMVRGPQRRDKW